MKRWSTTAVLSVCLTVLVVLVAAQEWRWIDKLEGYEHYRRDRQVGYAAWIFKVVFDREIDTLAHWASAPSGASADPAAGLADRLASWRHDARWPGLVAAAYVVTPSADGAEPGLARLDPEARVLEPVAWPSDLRPLARRLARPAASPSRGVPTDFLFEPSVPAIVGLPADPAGPCTLVTLDRAYLVEHMLPEIARIAFPPLTFESIDLAVVEAATGRVVFSTSPLARAADFGRADVVYGLVREGLEPADLTELAPKLRPGTSGSQPGISTVPPSAVADPTAIDEEWFAALWSWLGYTGHWRLLARYGADPAVEMVAAEKRRQVAGAFGLLALLATSVGALAIAARRTQRAARAELEQLARVSHELRTPLAVLATAGDNLADGVARGPGKARQYGAVIQRETRRLGELIENVLHLSRRRAGAPIPTPRCLDLVELVKASLDAAAPSLREAGFTVERSLPAERVEVRGDPRALRSAVLNLVSNAMKYGREARWLRLAVERCGASEARLVVEDRGPGIATQDLARLFEPYFRGDHAIAAQVEGSGLGLAVVRDVVAAHAGRVSVGSRPGGGAVFTLHLPLATTP